MKNLIGFKNNILLGVFAVVFMLSLISVSSNVLAAHDTTVTINPDVANCDQLGNTFTVNVKNDAPTGGDSILQVEIYKALAGLSDFVCGDAPTGWTLFSYTDRCIYVTGLSSGDKIAPGEDLDFTFNATMEKPSSGCTSDFIVVSVDDASPTGDRVTKVVSVNIDCTDPVIEKTVGTPKIDGDGFFWWITQSTQIDITGSDSNDTCDLGMDYCIWRYKVDGGSWNDWETHYPGCDGNVSFTISFSEDSVHDIQIECYDKAGNKATLNETDKVDSTPPTTVKTYGTPFHTDGIYDWITSDTTINLTATDGGDICAVGVDELYYRVTKLNVPDWDCVAECDFDGSGNWNDTNDDHVQFKINEDSCHLIEFYSVDELGNIESVNRQCVFVDNKPPEGTKTVGTPSIAMEPGSPFDWWVTQDTAINLHCTDQDPHPVNLEKVCYKVNFDGSDVTGQYCSAYGGSLNDDGYCCVEVNTNEYQEEYRLKFTQDSNHTLSYYCEDGLGNKNNVDTEYFKVDSKAPTISKTVAGPQYGDCPPEMGEKCWLKDWTNGNGATITVNAEDSENNGCVVDDVKCQWWYYRDGDGPYYIDTDYAIPGKSLWLTPPFDIKFYNETQHELHIVCKDALGNDVSDVETFYVDSTPPETVKTYGTPHYCKNNDCSAPEWINGTTLITLTPYDRPNATCASGVNKTFYKVTLEDDSYCLSQSECDTFQVDSINDPWNPGTGWNEYTTPFSISEESCHVIQFYSVDNLGNVEPIYHQCVFVDNTPPDVWKDIGDPKVNKQGDVYTYITKSTPITISCEDQLPHPVGEVNIWYRYRISDDCQNWGDWIDPATYCNNPYEGDWCDYVEDGLVQKTIYFPEDSCHQLEYYCVDVLGNKADTQSEIDIVDTQPPVTTEEITGPVYEHEGKTYIDNATRIHLTCTDPQPHPVGDITIYYRYRVDEGYGFGGWTGWSTYADPIWFPQESHHELEYYCEDALGNKETTHTEEFYVDHTPPTTLKVYGQPRYPVEIKTDNLCYKDVDNNWECYNTLPSALSDIGYTELPEGSLTYKASGPVLEITVKLSGLKPETEYQLTLNGRNGGDGNDELANNCPNPNGPKEGYEYAWECGYWSSGIGQEGFWNFDMKATTDSNGNYEKTYYLEMPEGHYGIPEDNNPPYGVGFIVKEAADAPGGSNYPPILMEYHGLDWTIEPYEYPLWITSETPIMLMPSDGTSIHASGVAATYYKDVYLPDEEDWHYCYSDCDAWTDDNRSTVWDIVNGLPTAPEPYNPSSRGFVLYEGPFKLQKESCHIIEYYSYDNVKKVEEVKHQCVFVDDTPPTPTKEVGEPKTKWDGSDAYYYDIADKCWNESSNDYMECWKVTLFTPISLDCTDPEPHPVDNEKVCFNVELDGSDTYPYEEDGKYDGYGGMSVTERYCEEYDGELTYDDEYDKEFCCVDHTIEDFYFLEETEHELEYYCIDALGNSNKEDLDIEKFKVEGKPFKIYLNKKWNLISVPFVMLDDSIDDVFKDIKDDVLAVWTYDAAADQWYVYTPDGDDSNDNLHTMKPGWGYWVITNKPTVLEIGGSLFSPAKTPPDKKIVHGWNLIGYYGTDWAPYDMDMTQYYNGPVGSGYEAQCALYSLGKDMWDKGWTALVTYWEPWNPDQWLYLDKWDDMDPGAGYWLFYPGTDDSIYAFTTTCGGMIP